MMKKKLTLEQKHADTDIWVIVLVMVIFMSFYFAIRGRFEKIMEDASISVLLRVLSGAFFQFGIAGLGISIVMLYRRQPICFFGLRRKNAGRSILFCTMCFLPLFIHLATTKQITTYLPFGSVWTTKEIITSGFPTNILGMLITWIAWGFFEGFNYVVISEKVNTRYPSKNRYLNWGAISCAVMCVVIHGIIGVTPGEIVEMASTMFLIYGMLVVKELTGNAWGIIIVFTFLWNAF